MEKRDELVQRIWRLERTVRVFKTTAIAGTATLGAILLINAASPRSPEIVAKKLSIVDPRGTPALVLSATDAGSSIWWFSEGSLRGSMSASRDSTSFQLYTADGRESRVTLRVDEENNPVLLMLDRQNVVRLQIAVNKDGKPNLKLFDETHSPRGFWGMNSEGEAGLLLLNRNGILVGGIAPQEP
jgi:hypothetical protein